MSSPSFHIVGQMALRTWRKTLRRPVPLTFSFVQPLLWMLIFGFLFQRFTLGPEYAGLAYLDFLLPGICAMTVLFGASQAGISLVRDIQIDFVQRMVRATTGTGWMLIGKLTADVLRLFAQAVFVAVAGVVVGARLHPGGMATLVATAALVLFALAYACLSCWIALTTKKQESMAVFVHVVNMPLLFTSTALVPTRQMPAWLERIAAWNPLTLVTDALREALLFHRMPDLWTTFLPLVVLAALLFLAARAALARAGQA